MKWIKQMLAHCIGQIIKQIGIVSGRETQHGNLLHRGIVIVWRWLIWMMMHHVLLISWMFMQIIWSWRYLCIGAMISVLMHSGIWVSRHWASWHVKLCILSGHSVELLTGRGTSYVHAPLRPRVSLRQMLRGWQVIGNRSIVL